GGSGGGRKGEKLGGDCGAAGGEGEKAKAPARFVGGRGGWGGPEPPVNSLRWLEGALGRLQGVVDGADAPPSADARSSYVKLKAAVETAIGEWKKIGGGK